jgi:hypothetical protein
MYFIFTQGSESYPLFERAYLNESWRRMAPPHKPKKANVPIPNKKRPASVGNVRDGIGRKERSEESEDAEEETDLKKVMEKESNSGSTPTKQKSQKDKDKENRRDKNKNKKLNKLGTTSESPDLTATADSTGPPSANNTKKKARARGLKNPKSMGGLNSRKFNWKSKLRSRECLPRIEIDARIKWRPLNYNL